MAFYIYWNLKPFSERKYLTAEDFEEVLPLAQSREAFGLLDRDGNGKLTPRELCLGVCEIFRWVTTPLCLVQVVPSHPAYSLALSVFDLGVHFETEPGYYCCSLHTPHALLHCTLTALQCTALIHTLQL